MRLRDLWPTWGDLIGDVIALASLVIACLGFLIVGQAVMP